MKKIKFFAWLLATASLTIGFSSCEDDDEDSLVTPPAVTAKTIADIAIENNQTDSLVVALTRVNLVSIFQNSGTYTVFAPTNTAFVNFLATNSAWNSIADIPETALTEVLQYHVLATEVKAADLTDATYATTLNTQGPGGTATVIEVDVTGGVKLNNNANVTTADIDASNGVIHLIDAVITPRNVTQLALNDERFTSLVSALTAYPSFNYASVLQGTGPFTVFAPTNDAFDALIAATPAWNSLADIDSVTLKKVLEYHVVGNVNAQSSDLSQDQVIPTLGGQNLTVDLSSGAQLITADTTQGPVNIIVTNVQGTNGVVHAVDKVLLPVL